MHTQTITVPLPAGDFVLSPRHCPREITLSFADANALLVALANAVNHLSERHAEQNPAKEQS